MLRRDAAAAATTSDFVVVVALVYRMPTGAAHSVVERLQQFDVDHPRVLAVSIDVAELRLHRLLLELLLDTQRFHLVHLTTNEIEFRFAVGK